MAIMILIHYFTHNVVTFQRDLTSYNNEKSEMLLTGTLKIAQLKKQFRAESETKHSS